MGYPVHVNCSGLFQVQGDARETRPRSVDDVLPEVPKGARSTVGSMTRSDAVRTLNSLSFRAHEAATKRGLFAGDIRPGELLMGIARAVANAYGHVKRSQPLTEVRVDVRGRRYGFAVDMARAVVGIMSLCYRSGVDIGPEIVAEIERAELKAKKARI